MQESARALAHQALTLLDISTHEGVHPRLGVVDVVPFVPYDAEPAAALAARDRFAEFFAGEGVPCFLYGPERSLPDIRRRAWRELSPDLGPPEPHPTAGACCVGERGVLLAYNLVVEASLAEARVVARQLRSPSVRALGLPLGDEVQVSLNLIDPDTTGPEEVYDRVAGLVTVKRAELVGLAPRRLVEAVDTSRVEQLDLSPERTVEARLARRGVDA